MVSIAMITKSEYIFVVIGPIKNVITPQDNPKICKICFKYWCFIHLQTPFLLFPFLDWEYITKDTPPFLKLITTLLKDHNQ